MIVILEEVALGKAIRDQAEVIIIRSEVASIILVMCLGKKFIFIISNKSVSIFYLKYVKVVEKKIEEKKNLKNEWSIFFSSVYSLNSSSLNLFVVVLAQTECHLVYVKLQLNIALLSILLLCTVTPSGFDFKRYSYCLDVTCKAPRCRFMLQINYLKYFGTFSFYA